MDTPLPQDTSPVAPQFSEAPKYDLSLPVVEKPPAGPSSAPPAGSNPVSIPQAVPTLTIAAPPPNPLRKLLLIGGIVIAVVTGGVALYFTAIAPMYKGDLSLTNPPPRAKVEAGKEQMSQTQQADEKTPDITAAQPEEVSPRDTTVESMSLTESSAEAKPAESGEAGSVSLATEGTTPVATMTPSESPVTVATPDDRTVSVAQTESLACADGQRKDLSSGQCVCDSSKGYFELRLQGAIVKEFSTSLGSSASTVTCITCAEAATRIRTLQENAALLSDAAKSELEALQVFAANNKCAVSGGTLKATETRTETPAPDAGQAGSQTLQPVAQAGSQTLQPVAQADTLTLQPLRPSETAASQSLVGDSKTEEPESRPTAPAPTRPSTGLAPLTTTSDIALNPAPNSLPVIPLPTLPSGVPYSTTYSSPAADTSASPIDTGAAAEESSSIPPNPSAPAPLPPQTSSQSAAIDNTAGNQTLSTATVQAEEIVASPSAPASSVTTTSSSASALHGAASEVPPEITQVGPEMYGLLLVALFAPAWFLGQRRTRAKAGVKVDA